MDIAVTDYQYVIGNMTIITGVTAKCAAIMHKSYGKAPRGGRLIFIVKAIFFLNKVQTSFESKISPISTLIPASLSCSSIRKKLR